MNIKIKLPSPHSKQQEFLDSKARFKVLLAGRRFGKSLICEVISIIGTLQNHQIGYITPTYSLAKVFFDDILTMLPQEVIVSANKSDLEIKLITGGTLTFFTGERLDNLRGRKFHLVIMDEAAYLPDLEQAWLNSIRPTLTDYAGSAVFISTPRGKNYFYSLYIKGLNKQDGFESFKYTTYDNPFIDDEEIDAAKDTLPIAVFSQEYLANPISNQSNPFGTDNIINNTIPELSRKESICYGIDLAKTYDWTVIIGLDEDGKMSYFDRFQLPWALTIEKIIALPNDINKLVDSTGVGDVVLEQLQLQCDNVDGFKFTSSSKPQLIMGLIKAIEMGELKYLEIVANELSVFEYIINKATGHIKYRAQSGFHDDTVIALALAYLLKKEVAINNSWTLYSA